MISVPLVTLICEGLIICYPLRYAYYVSKKIKKIKKKKRKKKKKKKKKKNYSDFLNPKHRYHHSHKNEEIHILVM